ncbi:hypothetical protein IWX47DRAFT_852848, partial [Phyllosticta citricarpa]
MRRDGLVLLGFSSFPGYVLLWSGHFAVGGKRGWVDEGRHVLLCLSVCLSVCLCVRLSFPWLDYT